MKQAAWFAAGLSVLLTWNASAQSATPSDEEIAAMIMAANTGEIKAGRLAKSNGASKEVQAFAQQMITDHTSMNQKATALTQKLNLKPQDNETSEQLKQDNEKSLTALKGLKGAAFDKAYIADQVTTHKLVLENLDGTLLPSAQNLELKSMLTNARETILLHLQHAQQLQNRLQ